jgi:hypothetical protein
MKTIYEWIEICKKAQPEIGQEWEDNVLAQRIVISSEKYLTMSDAIIQPEEEGNFHWFSSPQGHGYWNNIRLDMRSNPNKYIIPKRKLFNKA